MLPSHGYATGWQDSLDDQIVHQAWILLEGLAEYQLVFLTAPGSYGHVLTDLEMDDAGLLGRLPAGFFQRFQDCIHLPGLVDHPLQNFPGTRHPRIRNPVLPGLETRLREHRMHDYLFDVAAQTTDGRAALVASFPHEIRHPTDAFYPASDEVSITIFHLRTRRSITFSAAYWRRSPRKARWLSGPPGPAATCLHSVCRRIARDSRDPLRSCVGIEVDVPSTCLCQPLAHPNRVAAIALDRPDGAILASGHLDSMAMDLAVGDHS